MKNNSNYEISLIAYAEAGMFELVKKIIKYVNINYQSSDMMGATALYMAVQNNHIEIVKILLDHGADTEIKTYSGVTTLHRAVQDNNIEILKMLLQYGANPNVINNKGLSALYIAEYLKYYQAVELLIDYGVNLKNSIYGIDKLEEALYKGDFIQANRLLNAGAILAVDKRHPTLPLIAKDFYTLYLYKQQNEISNTCNSNINENLILAVRKQEKELVKNIILQGADVNYADKYGKTALIFAVENNAHDTLCLLLEEGANPNLLTNQGYSALTIAAYLGNNIILQTLLNKGADPNLKQARSPLFAAVFKGNLEAVQILFEAGISLVSNRKNPIFTALSLHHPKYGKSPELHNLIMNKYFENLALFTKDKLDIQEDKFEVVVVRYDEDLHWVEKEFGNSIKVSIYNKGQHDLDYLPSSYNVIDTPNIGYLGGTYLQHIVENYPNFADRVLFLQGWPYDSVLLTLPMIKYSYTNETTCLNIIGNCMKSSISKEDDYLNNIDWENSKYINFLSKNYGMKSYAQNFVNKSIDNSEEIFCPYAALFAVEKNKILANNLSYYSERLPLFVEKYPMVDHFQERLWDLDFYDQNNPLSVYNISSSSEIFELGDMFFAGYSLIKDLF